MFLDLVGNQAWTLMPLESEPIYQPRKSLKFQPMEMKRKNQFRKRVSRSSLMNIDGVTLTGKTLKKLSHNFALNHTYLNMESSLVILYIEKS